MPQRFAGAVTGGWLLAAVLALAQAPSGSPPDWSQWRGPNRDGISPETGLLQQWPAGGPPRVWQTTGAGIGFSSFSTSGGRLYTIGARDDVEGARPPLQAGAADRHEVRERREPEVAVERPIQPGQLATRRGQLHLALRGRPCRVYSGDLRVRVDETDMTTYPDVTVVCGSLTTSLITRDSDRSTSTAGKWPRAASSRSSTM